MDHQHTSADSELSQKRRKTRKKIFLGRMDKLIPWKRLEKIIPKLAVVVAPIYSTMLCSGTLILAT